MSPVLTHYFPKFLPNSARVTQGQTLKKLNPSTIVSLSQCQVNSAMERCDSWRVDFCQGGGDLPLNSRNEDALEVQQHGRDCQNNPNARGQLCERLPLVHILGILHSLECCLDAAQLFQR